MYVHSQVYVGQTGNSSGSKAEVLMNGSNYCSSIFLFCFVFAKQLCENSLQLMGCPFLIKAMFLKSKQSIENRPAHQSSVLESIFGAGFRTKHVIFLKCMSVAGCLAKSLGLLYLFLARAELGLGSAALQSCSGAQQMMRLLCWKRPLTWVQTFVAQLREVKSSRHLKIKFMQGI